MGDAFYEIALTLATEPIQRNEMDASDRFTDRRMKQDFTPKERQLAKQLVEAMQGN
jgi:hypothetical protein